VYSKIFCKISVERSVIDILKVGVEGYFWLFSSFDFYFAASDNH
jgi:hypothetical protein